MSGYPKNHTVPVTTATSGAATVYTPVVHGMISFIAYTKTDFASTADITVTTEDTAQAVWAETNLNASKAVYPVTAADLQSGSASVLLEVPMFAATERVKIVVAQAGNTKTGSFAVLIV